LGNFTSEGINAIADAIRVNGALTELCIDGNYVGDEGVSAVCEAIQSNKETKLASLYFRGNGIGPVGANAVAAMVAVTGALTKLSLAWNELGEEGTKAICEALKQNKTLKELDLSGRDNIGGEAGAEHVADMLGVNGGLTKISLAGNILEEEGTKAICKALKQNKTIKELDLSGYDNIGRVAGAKHVADMLGVNGGLTSLDLSSNELCGLDRYGRGTYTAEGITAIADALRVNGALTSISLANNMISGIGGQFSDGSGDLRGAFSIEGIAALADALSKSMTLRSVDLSNNSLAGVNRSGHGTFRPEGINLIADAIRVNGALTGIDLSGNQLCGIWTDDDGDQNGTYTAEGITAIADALRVNGSLTALDLSSNCLKDEGVSAVCKAIQSNKETKLTSLNFTDNGISPVGANAVAAMVAVTGAQTKIN
jgi:NLR family CARD domain-containing protein 3